MNPAIMATINCTRCGLGVLTEPRHKSRKGFKCAECRLFQTPEQITRNYERIKNRAMQEWRRPKREARA